MDKFWEYWFYDEDSGQWTKQDDDDDFEWCIGMPVGDIPRSFLEMCHHHDYKKEIIQRGWEIVRNLPVDEEEKNKQEWVHEAIYIDINNVDLVTVIFYEGRFDIYRQLHIQLVKKHDDYVYVNLTFEYR